MSARTVTLLGRQRMESLMVDTVRVMRQVTTGALDPVTGDYPRVVVYEGKGRVKTYEAQEAEPMSADFRYTEIRYTVQVPIGAGYAPTDPSAEKEWVEVIDSALLPSLVGNRYLVKVVTEKTHLTAYRLGVSDGPE